MKPYPLHKAVRNGDTNAVTDLLIMPEIDVNEPDARDLTALAYAVSGSNTNVEIVRALLKGGAEIDQVVLKRALGAGNPEVVGVLIVIARVSRSRYGASCRLRKRRRGPEDLEALLSSDRE